MQHVVVRVVGVIAAQPADRQYHAQHVAMHVMVATRADGQQMRVGAGLLGVRARGAREVFAETLAGEPSESQRRQRCLAARIGCRLTMASLPHTAVGHQRRARATPCT